MIAKFYFKLLILNYYSLSSRVFALVIIYLHKLKKRLIVIKETIAIVDLIIQNMVLKTFTNC
jgi:hypothetical protein